MITSAILNDYYKFGKDMPTRSGLYLRKYWYNLKGFSVLLMEQNPNTKSIWAGLKKGGHEVVQVSLNGSWYGVFVDGKLKIY